MSFDGMRGYLQLVTGLGDATRAKATEVAQGLLAMATRPNPAEMAQQVTHLAEEVLAAAQSNRDALVSMIRKEVEDLVESGPGRSCPCRACRQASECPQGRSRKARPCDRRGHRKWVSSHLRHPDGRHDLDLEHRSGLCDR